MKKILLILVTLSFFPLLTLTAQEESTLKELEGKRIAVIGDSYVRNHTDRVENTWHYKFAQKYRMQYLNYGRNGNCIAWDRARFGEAMYKRYTTMADSLDYILVIGGHNDAAMLDSMGGIEVFKEKLAILCEGLVKRYPAAKIFFFTRWSCPNFEGSNAQKVVDAMIEVCGRYGLPIFDCARKSGIAAWDEGFRKLYFQKSSDTAHLNSRGHDRFLPCAEHFILSY